MDAQFAEDIADVPLDRAVRDHQFLRCLLCYSLAQCRRRNTRRRRPEHLATLRSSDAPAAEGRGSRHPRRGRGGSARYRAALAVLREGQEARYGV